jgi:hypothetical protein
VLSIFTVECDISPRVCDESSEVGRTMNAVLALITLSRVVFSATAASTQPRDGLATFGPLPPPLPPGHTGLTCIYARLGSTSRWCYRSSTGDGVPPFTLYRLPISTQSDRSSPGISTPSFDGSPLVSSWNSSSLPRPPRGAMLSVSGPKRIFLLPEFSDDGPPH